MVSLWYMRHYMFNYIFQKCTTIYYAYMMIIQASLFYASQQYYMLSLLIDIIFGLPNYIKSKQSQFFYVVNIQRIFIRIA